jgi:hypothetical protein
MGSLDTQRSPKSKRGRNSGTNPDNSNIKDKQRYPRRSLTSAPPGGEVKSKNEGKSPRVHKGSRVSLEHPLEPPPMATPRQPSPEKHTMRNSTELRAALVLTPSLILASFFWSPVHQACPNQFLPLPILPSE